jgi:hypothetical protein
MCGVKRVLITGMSGTGKSTVIAALAAHGHKAVDVDDAEFSQLVSVSDETLTGLGSGTDWVWREDRVADLLAGHEVGTLFVSGTSPNQGKFYSQFDHVVLLVAPPGLITERLIARTGNDFGKDPDQLARDVAPATGGRAATAARGRPRSGHHRAAGRGCRHDPSARGLKAIAPGLGPVRRGLLWPSATS